MTRYCSILLKMATRITCNSSSITAIFFDLDNTLIATRLADKLTCNKLAEILVETHSISTELASSMCSSYLKAFRQCPDNPSMSLDKWRLLLWSQALKEPYKHLAGSVYVQWLDLRYQYLALTPEVKTLLIKLHQHYLLGLITNGPSSAQWEKVERLNLQQYFDVILISGDLPYEKPNKKIFQQACQYLGVQPEGCIMVGDKLETDIQGGIEAGLSCTVWIPLADSGLNNEDPQPDYILSSVIELPKILPHNPKVPTYRSNSVGMISNISKLYHRVMSLPDLEDCNSNSSDGS